MGARRHGDYKLHDDQKLSPLGSLGPGHVIDDESKDLLTFLMDPLRRTHFTRPHCVGLVVPHSHDGTELLKDGTLKLLPDACLGAGKLSAVRSAILRNCLFGSDNLSEDAS